MSKMAKKKNRCRFTLIELLVVVAIIGILASILMPSLAKAREAGKSAACVNNMKQMGTQVLGYSMNYDGWMVGVTGGWCCSGGGWNSKNIQGWRVDLRTEGLAVNSSDPALKSCPSVLAEVLGTLGPATDDGTVNTTSAGRCYGGGIGLNMNFGIRNWPADARLASRMKVSELYNPSHSIMMADTRTNETDFDHYVCPRKNVGAAMNGGTPKAYSWDANQAFRHNNRSNVGWNDGHVSSEAPGELGATPFALAYNVGWMGPSGNDAYYALTKADFEEYGIKLGDYDGTY